MDAVRIRERAVAATIAGEAKATGLVSTLVGEVDQRVPPPSVCTPALPPAVLLPIKCIPNPIVPATDSGRFFLAAFPAAFFPSSEDSNDEKELLTGDTRESGDRGEMDDAY